MKITQADLDLQFVIASRSQAYQALTEFNRLWKREDLQTNEIVRNTHIKLIKAYEQACNDYEAYMAKQA